MKNWISRLVLALLLFTILINFAVLLGTLITSRKQRQVSNMYYLLKDKLANDIFVLSKTKQTDGEKLVKNTEFIKMAEQTHEIPNINFQEIMTKNDNSIFKTSQTVKKLDDTTVMKFKNQQQLPNFYPVNFATSGNHTLQTSKTEKTKLSDTAVMKVTKTQIQNIFLGHLPKSSQADNRKPSDTASLRMAVQSQPVSNMNMADKGDDGFKTEPYIHYLLNNNQGLKLEINYEPFQIREPNFINDFDRKLFYKIKHNSEYLRQQPPIALRGEIHVITNGTFQEPYDCGYKSLNSSYMTKPRVVSRSNWHRVIVPLNVPDGHTFQHFFDGTLPKKIQALDFLTYPETRILVERKPRDKILYEIFEKLGIKKEKFIYNPFRKSFGADQMISACIAPPIHPKLWKKARTMLGAHKQRKGYWIDGTVVLMTRSGSFNSGRRLLNQIEVITMLTKRYGSNNIHVYNGPYNLTHSIETFGKAKIVIGVHGGGLQNIFYCTEGTVVIEIMPQYETGKLVLVHGGVMYWVQSNLLDLAYWRLSSKPTTSTGNVIVDLKKLESVLNKVDERI